MEQAQIHLTRTFRWIQEKLFAEDKALAKKRLEARVRKNLPEDQTKVTDKKKGKTTKEEDDDGQAK